MSIPTVMTTLYSRPLAECGVSRLMYGETCPDRQPREIQPLQLAAGILNDATLVGRHGGIDDHVTAPERLERAKALPVPAWSEGFSRSSGTAPPPPEPSRCAVREDLSALVSGVFLAVLGTTLYGVARVAAPVPSLRVRLHTDG